MASPAPDKPDQDDPLEQTFPPSRRAGIPLVGIGASAGGLEAFSRLLASLPTDTGMAYVLITHLDPTHRSWLPELLGRRSALPVQPIEQDEQVQPNRVYVLPPNANLTVYDSTLRLLPRSQERGPNLPIDLFFRSLASEHGEKTVGVILSGTGSDGTLGAVEIKAMGGIVIAQDPGTAGQPGMPQSAIDAGAVDFVLPPEVIGQKLAELGAHPYLGPAAEPLEVVTQTEEDPEAQFARILQRVRRATGVDFHHYRDTTIRRRILRRLALHTHRSLGEYADMLEGDEAEVEALQADLLINVTSFFRDPEMFEELKRRVFPEIVRGKSATTPIRIWSPGCSTGQEAYSLVMALTEFLDDQPIRPPIQVFATDLSDPGALGRARAGLYPESIAAEVSPGRLQRFFRREDHLYRVDQSLREVCVFARQNITADPPFSHVDLISCRNVLIYMAPPLQRRVLPTFHYALNHPGFLVLGSSESIGEFGDLFEVVDRAHRIFTRRDGVARSTPFRLPEDLRNGVPLSPSRRAPSAHPTLADFQREADRVLLNRYAPAGVLVNEQFDILQFRGRTAPYLEMPAGDPTNNLLRMAPEGLFVKLRAALTEAVKQRKAVRREGLRLRRSDGARMVDVSVLPVGPSSEGGRLFLVLFEDPPAAGGQPAAAGAPPAPGPAGPGPADTEELERLRHELAATREYLQSLVDQQDAVNEELRSANEEILSSNEELQSTNEELETAKEELQSTNEELTTVNEQVNHRNAELSHLSNDLTNLLTSTNMPVMMVGSDLRIRRITAPALRIMNLLASDIGRPVSDIRLTPEIPDLEARVQQVMEEVRILEWEITDRDGHWYQLRLCPYRTGDHRIDGVVIVLVDIDQIKRGAEQLHALDVRLRQQEAFIEFSADAIITRDQEHHIQSWNRAATQLYGWTFEEALGKNADELLRTGSAAARSERDRLLRSLGRWEGTFTQMTRDGRTLTINSRQMVLRDEPGVTIAVLEINRQVTGS